MSKLLKSFERADSTKDPEKASLALLKAQSQSFFQLNKNIDSEMHLRASKGNSLKRGSNSPPDNTTLENQESSAMKKRDLKRFQKEQSNIIDSALPQNMTSLSKASLYFRSISSSNK